MERFFFFNENCCFFLLRMSLFKFNLWAITIEVNKWRVIASQLRGVQVVHSLCPPRGRNWILALETSGCKRTKRSPEPGRASCCRKLRKSLLRNQQLRFSSTESWKKKSRISNVSLITNLSIFTSRPSLSCSFSCLRPVSCSFPCWRLLLSWQRSVTGQLN